MSVRIIGIAGGIGSGKSTVTVYLRSKGYTVIDADEISHAVTEAGKPALGEIADAFGAKSIAPGGTLDRKYIADIVFNNSEKLAQLNKIMHKYIESEVNRSIESARRTTGIGIEASSRKDVCSRNDIGLIFLSAPLFFEADYHVKTDEVWLVSATEEIRIKRAAARDHADEQTIIARMKKQMPESERRERADVVIENNGSAEKLYDFIDKLLLHHTQLYS